MIGAQQRQTTNQNGKGAEMNQLQDVREAMAMWDRKFAGKRERVNLSGGRQGGLLAKLVKSMEKGVGPIVSRQPAYGL